MVGPFLAPCLRIWLFSGLDLTPWQKVDLATLAPAPTIEKCKKIAWAPASHPWSSPMLRLLQHTQGCNLTKDM